MNSLNGLALPILGVLVSLLVIRLASVELWGSFVQVLIVVQLAAHVVAWGNKEYLLRAFSRHPARLATTWQSSLSTRAILLLALAPIPLLLGWPLQRALLAAAWTIALVAAQAADVLVVYRRAFGFALLVELAAAAGLVVAIVAMAPGLDLDPLILLFALASVGRAAVFLLRFRRLVLPRGDGGARFRLRPDPAHLRLALPFFLLGLTGMLQSRVDLYSVSFMLPPGDVARYQVLINLLIYVQAMANFVVLPFARSLYRLPHASTLRFSARLFATGLPLIVAAVAGIHLVLRHLYGFDLPWPLLLLGGLYAWPIYFALPIIYALYRETAEATVIRINAVGFALNLALNLYLIPRMGVAGALLATTLVQWLTLVVYFSVGRSMGGRDAPALS